MKTNEYTVSVSRRVVDRERAKRLMGELDIFRRVTADYIRFASKHKFGVDLHNHMKTRVRQMRGSIIDEINPKSRYTVGRDVPGQGRMEYHSESLKSCYQELFYRIRSIRRVRKNKNDELAERAPMGIYKKFVKRILSRDKFPSPTDEKKYLGIEIECCIPESKIENEDVFLPVAKWINLGHDGSITPPDGMKGREVRILCTREEASTVIPQVVGIIKSIGGTVNKSCGLHIHIDHRTLDPRANYQKLVRSLSLLYKVVPNSRKDNTYCKRNRTLDFNTARRSRYQAINPCAFSRHKTLEVRLFGGTLNPGKILNWIDTLLSIISGEMPTRCPRTFKSAKKVWHLPDPVVTWLEAREKLYAAPADVAPDECTDDQIAVAA